MSGLLSGGPKAEDVPEANVPVLREKLLNKQLPLFERYRAMFALRNIGTPGAVNALAAGFSDDSALFKYAPSLQMTTKTNLASGMRLPSFLDNSCHHIPFLHLSLCYRMRVSQRWYATRLLRRLAG